MLLLSYPAVAETVTENFADDPFWVSFNSTAASDNYGYSATNNAGGAIGEAGGVFGLHDAFDSYYADLDLGGTLYAGSSTPGQAELLTASGKISIDKSQSSNNNMSIAFFDQTNPTKGGDALRINIIDGNRFKLWLRLEIGKNLESPLVSGLVDGEYTWTMDWDPNGSADGLGEGTVTFNGISAGTPASISATLDIPMRNEGSNPEWLEEDIVFNAFGLHNFDGEANSANFIETFIDDVTYSVASAPSSSSTWGETGSGFWTDSRNWSPGEVPFGNDRTAVLGEGVTGDTTLLTSTVLTVKNIDFDNALFDYAVAGSSSTSLTLEADAGNATVNVIAVPLLLSKTTVSVLHANARQPTTGTPMTRADRVRQSMLLRQSRSTPGQAGRHHGLSQREHASGHDRIAAWHSSTAQQTYAGGVVVAADARSGRRPGQRGGEVTAQTRSAGRGGQWLATTKPRPSAWNV